MRKHLIALLVITPLLLSSQLSLSHAASKAGAKCNKAGITSVASGKKFTCIKSGKKFVWDKGKQASSAGGADDKLLYAGINNPLPTKGWLTSFPLPTKEDALRSYTMYIPSTWKSDVVSPLLIALHGLSGWDLQLMDNTAFNNLAEANKIELITEAEVIDLEGTNHLERIVVKHQTIGNRTIEADHFIPLFGLKPSLGPIANWGLEIEKNAIKVDPKDYSTAIPGVYAVGDVNTYENKLKLILCGFHEGTMAVQSAFARIYPDKKNILKYTTVNGIQGF